MYDIGDLIIYSAHGICKIEDICDKTISGKTKKYYVMHPLENNHKLTISTPVDNEKVIMKKLVPKEDAKLLIDSFKGEGKKWIDNPNMRSQKYNELVATGNRLEIAKIINTLMRMQMKVESEGKKFYEQDRKLLGSLQSILFKELAISLNTTFENIHQTVLRQIEKRN
ncbi:CarD family transcriptional regulator [Bacillus sp. FJAT-27225]|uniref:CarD family transcriptional regulator n=1 Tax=Bacillus sp. FJAT-27225 TaxID=1743144 RepID=UPI00080C2608|nr:CarD family transcriptional regulator [Bacillus sp. FJAT-27225]OCA89290.1 CarD family transcriptional regulator [Bacillus sp. FJAT-27225]